MKRVSLVLFVVFACLLIPLALALAQVAAPTVPTDPSTIVGGIVAAFGGKQWTILIGFLLAGVIFLFRTFALAKWKWAQTSRGGVAVAFFVGVVGVVAGELIAGQASVMSIVDGILATWVASGMFTQARAIAKAPTPVA
jgi:hypothetical protein